MGCSSSLPNPCSGQVNRLPCCPGATSSQSVSPIPWVKEFYHRGQNVQFEQQSVNRVRIYKRPVIAGAQHTDLYFYLKKWKQYHQALYISFHWNVSRVDISIVLVQDVDISFYQEEDRGKKNLKKKDITYKKVIDEALELSYEPYSLFTNTCNDSAGKLIKKLQ